MAVSHYSMAMDLDPSDASLYANRAAALLKWATSTKVSVGLEVYMEGGVYVITTLARRLALG